MGSLLAVDQSVDDGDEGVEALVGVTAQFGELSTRSVNWSTRSVSLSRRSVRTTWAASNCLCSSRNWT